MSVFPLLALSTHKFSPLKPLSIFASNHCNSSKDPILTASVPSKSNLGGSLRVLNNMAKSSKDRIFASQGAEWSGIGETESNSQVGISELGGRFRWSDFEAFLNRMSKWLVAFLFGIIILWKHDAEALWVAMGSVLNSYLSVTLKKILNHQRPVSGLKPDPGMPSSHAQSIFYTATFVIFSLVRWLGLNILSVAFGTTTFLTASYFTWLRVSQRLHTISQILVGALLGCTVSITWLWLWHSFVLKAYISSIWVQILVVLSFVVICSSFLVYVVKHWFLDEH